MSKTVPDTLVIRADASPDIGAGHVMRCLALAQAWRKAGGEVLFVHAEIASGVAQRLAAERMRSVVISAPRGTDEDAMETSAQAAAKSATWVVADGYCFNAAWQRRIKSRGHRLLLVDDYGHLDAYEADIVLNQNASATEAMYAKRSASTALLLGSPFAMLRSEFLVPDHGQREAPVAAKKLLVTLGGADPDNVTAKVIAAVKALPDIEATVVVGGANRNLAQLETAAADCRRVTLAINPANMPELMAAADFAFTAAGSTVWETAKFGVPVMLAVLAENQARIAEEIDRRGVGVNLGWHEQITVEAIGRAIRSLAADAVRRREMAANGRKLIDGRGASRVAAALGAKLEMTIVSDRDSWINDYLGDLKAGFEREGHRVRWIHQPSEIAPGDITFFLSLSRFVPPEILRRNAHNLVVHESALPHGRGWSPLTWQVLEGKSSIPVSLIEAVEAVDAGEIYAQETIDLCGNEVVDELRARQAASTVRLCHNFVARYPFCLADARAQEGTPTYYPRRRPADSRLDPDKTFREQFNLLRVADSDRYPVFVEIEGRRFYIRVTPA